MARARNKDGKKVITLMKELNPQMPGFSGTVMELDWNSLWVQDGLKAMFHLKDDEIAAAVELADDGIRILVEKKL